MKKVSEYNLRLGTNHYEIWIDTPTKYGYFEHTELGEDSAGGLWFDENLKLVDYDGVFELPSEVKDGLIMMNFIDKDCAKDF